MTSSAASSPDLCPECEGKVDPVSHECKWCGFNVVTQKHPPKKRGKVWILSILLGICMVLGGIGLLSWNYLTTPDPQPKKQTHQEQQNIVEAAIAIEKMRELSTNPDFLGSISIQKALQQNLIKARLSDIAFQSSRIRFQVQSLIKNPLQVVMDPCLLLFNTQSGGEWITLQNETVKVEPMKTVSVDILVARLKPISASGDYSLREMPEEHPVVKFISRTPTDSVPWNVLQIAIWVLNQDIDLDNLRKDRYSLPQGKEDDMLGSSYPIAESVRSIDAALKLLEKAGFDITVTQLYKDSEKTLAIAMEDYRNSQNDTQNLETIGFFRTRPEARNILCEVFARHPNPEGIQLRKSAFRSLTDMILNQQTHDVAEGQQIMEILDDAIQKEKDLWLKQDMNREFEKAKKTLAQILTSKENS